ncbi:sigma-54 interaction domain-containing protein [Thiohalomonas denitrificans]|uniref:Transcriptional regulator containing PAS, AAA-type ATPase, and DNA-binding Fis domains n=1 Tax=Thiohalomonas denitrificans TaxID=415747 RepID=A0A1G5Q8X5_9GAMM|nr:sigma-54-dependent Fis family transcriptional regulator [Thiohalomonas denitrificans]SCZ58127.1 Transcriptional regulator containing PAS, AAA-type ATPase, and DNA-binding Fis domains [Thiohalomonas denitrificans]
MNEKIPAEVVSIIDSFGQPAVIISRDYRILAANGAYKKEYGDPGPSGESLCYRMSHHYQLPCDQAGETCPLKACRETGLLQRDLHLHHTPSGEEHVEVEMMPVRGESGEPNFYLEIMHHSRLASSEPTESGLVGRSSPFNRVLELVRRVAPSEAAALLLGESGTGKELVAQAVHDASSRAKGPFVPVECSGLTESLFESELFGHEKGAFTGAQAQKIGLVEAARGGTLFLDEIGDVPLSLQVKLLRLLETRTFRRVGGIEPQKADFRLVCATHRGLKKMVETGEFRSDLFYRINAFPITIPSLRERVEDLPLLCENLLRRLNIGRTLTLSAEALDYLRAYDFPGNIRELRNILERASLLTDGDVILPDHLPDECRSGMQRSVSGPMPNEIIPLDEMERRYLGWSVARFQGEKRDLAARLGVSERTLYRKLQDLKIPEEAGH